MASDNSVPVLGLIFLKYADSRFQTASDFLSGQYFIRRGSPSKETYTVDQTVFPFLSFHD